MGASELRAMELGIRELVLSTIRLPEIRLPNFSPRQYQLQDLTDATYQSRT